LTVPPDMQPVSQLYNPLSSETDFQPHEIISQFWTVYALWRILDTSKTSYLTVSSVWSWAHFCTSFFNLAFSRANWRLFDFQFLKPNFDVNEKLELFLGCFPPFLQHGSLPMINVWQPYIHSQTIQQIFIPHPSSPVSFPTKLSKGTPPFLQSTALCYQFYLNHQEPDFPEFRTPFFFHSSPG